MKKASDLSFTTCQWTLSGKHQVFCGFAGSTYCSSIMMKNLTSLLRVCQTWLRNFPPRWFWTMRYRVSNREKISSHQNKPRINHLLTALQSHLTTPPPFRWWQQDLGEDPRIQTSQLDSACSMMRIGLWNRPYLSLHEYVFQIRHSWEIAHSWFRQRIAIKRDQGSSRTSTLITSSHWLWTIFYSELAS